MSLKAKTATPVLVISMDDLAVMSLEQPRASPAAGGAPGGDDPRRHPAVHPRAKFRVHLDGQTIEYPTAAETFARTIERIGVERVERLHKVLSGIPLIMPSKVQSYQNQFPVGKFYVCTHSDTPAKKRLLEQIADELGIRLRVELNPKD